jgi:hypothetical protein
LPLASDNKYPYVYTNPKDSTKLTHRDKVFVLSNYMTDELLTGILDKNK